MHIPHVDTEAAKDCEQCDGEGLWEAPCLHCSGNGCSECEGTGSTLSPCPYCQTIWTDTSSTGAK
jgi:DnaJ-class molecular chaperone